MHEASNGKASDEFVVNFLKVFRPLIIVSIPISLLAMFGGIAAGFKVLSALVTVVLTISLCFSIFKLFRFRYPFLPYNRGWLRSATGGALCGLHINIHINIIYWAECALTMRPSPTRQSLAAGLNR